MRLVGLTGGIGSGKSTVAALLAEHGAGIIDADQIARDLQRSGSPVLAAMVDRFGEDIVRADGSLDRAAVAAIVFADTDDGRAALADLNAITHPAIGREVDRRIEAHAATDGVVVLDHPLLAERPRSDLSAFVVVDVDPDVAVRRLVEFRGMHEQDARNRIARQISRAERLALATHVIRNDGDLAELRRHVDRLWADLTR